jgi:hypothetical protein
MKAVWQAGVQCFAANIVVLAYANAKVRYDNDALEHNNQLDGANESGVGAFWKRRMRRFTEQEFAPSFYRSIEALDCEQGAQKICMKKFAIDLGVEAGKVGISCYRAGVDAPGTGREMLGFLSVARMNTQGRTLADRPLSNLSRCLNKACGCFRLNPAVDESN